MERFFLTISFSFNGRLKSITKILIVFIIDENLSIVYMLIFHNIKPIINQYFCFLVKSITILNNQSTLIDYVPVCCHSPTGKGYSFGQTFGCDDYNNHLLFFPKFLFFLFIGRYCFFHN